MNQLEEQQNLILLIFQDFDKHFKDFNKSQEGSIRKLFRSQGVQNPACFHIDDVSLIIGEKQNKFKGFCLLK